MRVPACILTWAALWTALGCAYQTAAPPGGDPLPEDPRRPAGVEPKEVVWQGEVRIESDRLLPRGSRLRIEPGTRVTFAYRDDDGDGWGDASLRVEGDLIVRGTPDRPVVFTSEAAPPTAGGWGEIRVDFGSLDLRYAVIEGSTRGVHAHFSKGAVVDSIFRWNVDGTRLGESALRIENCLFYGHTGKALNARNCRNSVRGNSFHHNRNGIFLFEQDGGSAFRGNRFRHNDHPFRLGDFFEGEVTAAGNDWGRDPPREADGLPARLRTSPAPVRDAGVPGWPRWQLAWRTPVAGFVDAAPVLTDEGVYVASWGGEVARLGHLDGASLARVRLPDAVDASPAVGHGVIAVPCWDRGVYLLDRASLETLDVFRSEPSPADDHRQASPWIEGNALFVATWAGSVLRFQVSDGRLNQVWAHRAGGPFRAGLRLARGLLLAPCEDGMLYALEPSSGEVRWKYRAGAPLLSAVAEDGRRAYLGDRSGTFHAVDLDTGWARWTSALGGAAWYAPPLLAGGVLYQGDDGGTVRALDPETGQVRWVAQLEAAVRSRPSPAGTGAIAVATLGGRVYLLDRATGLERDCWVIGEAVHSSATPAGSRIFFGSREGAVYALDALSR